MIPTLLLVLLIIILAIGLTLVIFGLPGTWLILAGVIGYGWLADFDTPGKDWLVITIVAALTVLGEIIEFLAGVVSAKYWKVPDGAIIISFIGGIIGAAVGFPIIIIGPILGMFIGAFVSAFLYGLVKSKDPIAATKIAIASLFSKGLSLFIKVVITVVIGLYVLFKLF